MRIDWWTLGLQTINAVVLIWLLSRFLFKPIAAIVAARRQAADALLADAHAAKAQAEQERAGAAAQTRALADQRAGAFAAIEAQAMEHKARMLAQVQQEADTLRAAAHAQREAARQAETDAVHARAVALAVDIAAKVLERLPDDALIDGFIDGLAAQVPKLSAATRATLGIDGTPLRMRVARAPNANQAERCRKALSDALDRPIVLDWVVEPSLIAGLELDAEHASIRNSLRSDLELVSTELLSDGHGPD
jgi:F-type H+-transporting ATPase subunit b